MNNSFIMAICITMLFGGVLKVISFNDTKTKIQNIKLFASPFNIIFPYAMPVFEILIPLFVYCMGESVAVFILITAYYFFFVAINLTSIYDEIDCCCYGKFMKSKLGLGGVVYYSFYLCLDIVAVYCYKWNIHTRWIQFEKNELLKILLAVVLVVSGLLVRRAIELIHIGGAK